MAEEKEVKEAKSAKKAEAICPPFTILHKIVLGETAYQPGDEEKLRPLLSAENFHSLCALKAITRI